MAAVPFFKVWPAGGVTELQFPPRPRAPGATRCSPAGGGRPPGPSTWSPTAAQAPGAQHFSIRAVPPRSSGSPTWPWAPSTSTPTSQTALPLAVGAGGPFALPLHVAAQRLAGLDSGQSSAMPWRCRGRWGCKWRGGGRRRCCGWSSLSSPCPKLLPELITALLIQPHIFQLGTVARLPAALELSLGPQ